MQWPLSVGQQDYLEGKLHTKANHLWLISASDSYYSLFSIQEIQSEIQSASFIFPLRSLRLSGSPRSHRRERQNCSNQTQVNTAEGVGRTNTCGREM